MTALLLLAITLIAIVIWIGASRGGSCRLTGHRPSRPFMRQGSRWSECLRCTCLLPAPDLRITGPRLTQPLIDGGTASTARLLAREEAELVILERLGADPRSRRGELAARTRARFGGVR